MNKGISCLSVSFTDPASSISFLVLPKKFLLIAAANIQKISIFAWLLIFKRNLSLIPVSEKKCVHSVKYDFSFSMAWNPTPLSKSDLPRSIKSKRLFLEGDLLS